MTETDLKAQGVIWERNLRKSGRKFIGLRAWGVTGNDLRASGVIWERKFDKLPDASNGLRAWEVTGSHLGGQIVQIR